MKCCLFQFSKYQNCYCQNSHSSLGKYCYCPYVVCNGKRWTNSILLFLKKIWEWRQILWGKLWWTFFFLWSFLIFLAAERKEVFPCEISWLHIDKTVLFYLSFSLFCIEVLGSAVNSWYWHNSENLRFLIFFILFLFVCGGLVFFFFFVIPICVNYSSASLNLCVSAQCCWRLFVLFEQAFVFVGLEHKGWHKGSPLKEALFWFWF